MYAVLNGTADAFRLTQSSTDLIHLERPAILTICGLHHRKGVDLLIRSFQHCQQTMNNLHLYIIGDGPERSHYEQIASDKSTNIIHFCGYVKDTLPYMRSADAFILVSRADPAPLVISEARVAGMAVIATNVDGIAEMLDNSRAGILLHANDQNAITKAICYLFQDRATLERWRQRSQSNIEYNSIRRVAAQVQSVYENVLRSKKPE